MNLLNYKTKKTTTYLPFKRDIRPIVVQDEEKLSLWIEKKDRLQFFDGSEPGRELFLNDKLEPISGTVNGEKMSKPEQNEYLKKYQADIQRFYKASSPAFI